ncbi:AAA family ATPase [Paenibacillus sp. F411]|uniref:AAA family ATPase n=1 Tax=Paenibacillus sp. F411 TaxID=2820239 RepID=UPI001AB01122|nr:AAA family ATPase [Paenibacillus sp. F411]MBO2943617.1 AAA family ATPase [Paenibacillus sp. F411]
MAQIKLIESTAHNFKSHRDLCVKFGDLTKITGDNAEGKSSTLEIPTWTLYGTDTFGSKMDPTPTNYKYDHVMAETLLEVDGKEIKFGRGIEKGKITYYVNDVPSKAGDFDDIVKSLFDKDLFLALYNPSYFFSLHWEKQRELMLRYTAAPTQKEIFAEMSRTSPDQKHKDIKLNPQAEKLAELVKKHTMPQLVEIHKKNKNDKDAAHKRAQGRTEALEDQIHKLPDIPEDIEAIKAEDAELVTQIRAIHEKIELADEPKRKQAVLEGTLDNLRQQVVAARDRYMRVHGEEIAEECPTCKRPFDDGAKKAAEANKENRKKPLREEHDKLVARRKELEAELAAVELVDVSELWQQMRTLEQRRDVTADTIAGHKRREALMSDLAKARDEEAATLESRNDSIFILDAIKAFEAKEAEVQAAKVQNMFQSLTIRLFKEQKNGEIKADFVIEMDGKTPAQLSLSEGIRAGLEVRDVISTQSEMIAPCFVDNAESITRFKSPAGELITCRVVADQKLKIEQG